MSLAASAFLLAVVTAIACAIPGVFVVLSRQSMLIDGISPLRYASPFHYFRPVDLLAGTAPAGDLLVLVSIPLIAAVAAGLRFTHRDLTR